MGENIVMFMNRLKQRHPAFVTFFKQYEPICAKKRKQRYKADTHIIELRDKLQFIYESGKGLSPRQLEKLYRDVAAITEEFRQYEVLEAIESSITWSLLAELSQP